MLPDSGRLWPNREANEFIFCKESWLRLHRLRLDNALQDMLVNHGFLPVFPQRHVSKAVVATNATTSSRLFCHDPAAK